MAKQSSAFLFMNKFVQLFIILLIIFSLFFVPITVLEVRTNDTNAMVYQQMAKLGNTFDVRWKHSVTLQPVIETYKLEGYDKISLIQMVFDDNGPNLPAQPWEEQQWTIQDGKFIVTNYNKYFTKVPVTIGAIIADHTLIYNGKETSLRDVYRPGGFVYISVTKNNVYQFLTKEVGLWKKKTLKP